MGPPIKRAVPIMGGGSIQNVQLGGENEIDDSISSDRSLMLDLADIYKNLGNHASADRCIEKANQLREAA